MKAKLLKDLPRLKAGAIFTKSGVNFVCEVGRNEFYVFFAGYVESMPEWFEILEEWPKSFEDLKVIKGYYLNLVSEIKSYTAHSSEETKNTFPTEAHAKSALAFAQLSQLAARMNEDWAPDWSDMSTEKHSVECYENKLQVRICFILKCQIAFKTREMAEFSLKHHEQLWKDYWMI